MMTMTNKTKISIELKIYFNFDILIKDFRTENTNRTLSP